MTFRSASPHRRSRWFVLIGAVAALILIVGGTVLAAHPEVSLAGSNFEIDTDANLVRDDAAPSIDWASVSETRQNDAPTGQNDNSFGNGTKESTAVPSVVSGSIPNNKSDLKAFGVYLETTPANRHFLNLFWSRVQEPTGTTNMDFEFNQSSTLSSNGVTPVRTTGDALIQYDLSQGGTNPQLFISRWTAAGVWGPRTNLTAAGIATGSINTTPITAANADGLGALSARTFGEAQLDFDALASQGGSGTCLSFGSAYLKSRASDAFTAALKDFIAPTSLNLSNCGGVTIRKQTLPDEDPNATDFGFTKTFATQPATANSFNLKDDESFSSTSVVQGSNYVVDEATIPAGWSLTDITCTNTGVTPTIDLVAGTVTFSIDSPSDRLDCTYTNTLQQGAIQITKTAKHAADSEDASIPLEGVDFDIEGTTVTTDANGVACLDGLVFGDYTVTETAPAGYAGEDAREVTVDNTATCADDPYAGETSAWDNIPLTDVTVTVDSQVDGGTASTIECAALEADPDAETDANGDGSLAMTDLEPGTYTCTIVVDP